MQMLFVTYGVLRALLLQPFHNLLSEFTANAIHLPKQVVIEYVADPPTAVMTPRSSRHHQTIAETFERVDKSS